MSENKTTEMPTTTTCDNGHEHSTEGAIVADYGKLWRVRCETCRVIYSVSKK